MGVDGELDQQQWRINVHAKSRNFSLRIRATAAPPAPPKPHALSALLRLRCSVIKVESSSGPNHRRRRRETVRSLFHRLFSWRNSTPSPKQGFFTAAAPAAPLLRNPLSRLGQLAHEDPVGTWSVFIAVFILGAVAATALKGAIAAATGAFLPIPLVAALLLLLSPSASSALRNYATGLGGNRFFYLRLILPGLLAILVILGVSAFGRGVGKHFDFSRHNLVQCLMNALRSKLAV